MNYYNEFDPKTAAWLRQLIKNGDIADGEVDERSIVEVEPEDLKGFTQCHFFAGIGVWSYALRNAGWTDDRFVWTASLPCQPFSVAGNQKGKDDERHLLPHFLGLVRECKPDTIFGEQVDSAIRHTGKLRSDIEDLQSLQKREGYIRVLSELQRQGGKVLYDLHGEGESEEARTERKELRRLQEMEESESWECLEKCSCPPCERKRNGVGHIGRLGTDKDRCWSLRSDGDSFRSGHTKSMERPVIGQAGQLNRIHESEHTSNDLCTKCNDEYMGRTEDFRGIEWNNDSAKESIYRANREVDEKLEGTTPKGWLDDLQTNMEGEGYTVGHCVLGAHSVGKAHIRKRLYWVANRRSSESESNGDRRGLRKISGQDEKQQTQEKSRENKTEQSVNVSSDYGMAYAAGKGLERPTREGVQGKIYGLAGNSESNGRLSDTENRNRGAESQCTSGSSGEAWDESGRDGEYCGVADSECKQNNQEQQRPSETKRERGSVESSGCGSHNSSSRVAHSERPGSEGRVSRRQDSEWEGLCGHAGCDGPDSRMGDPNHDGHATGEKRPGNVQPGEKWREERPDVSRESTGTSGREKPAELSGCTDRCEGEQDAIDWLYCRDNKYRPIKSGIKPLVNGIARGVVHSGDSIITPNDSAEARAIRIKGYGNAIVAPVAEEFIRAFMSV